jgi:hypothetical protein
MATRKRKQAQQAIPATGKYKVYSREDGFACYVDGLFIGYADSPMEADEMMDKHVYEQLRRTG